MIDQFPIHDLATVPEASRPVLEAAREGYGFVPNLLGVLANSPVALRAYTTLAQLLEAGFERHQLLEVITALAFKTISNYTNHLAETPLDSAFRKTSWNPPEEV